MAVKDLHDNVQANVALKIQQIATDTTTSGEDIDRSGFESVEFLLFIGTLTDGDYAPNIQEADDDGAGSPDTYSNVAAADMIGTEAGATFDADTDDDTIGKIGYIGTKKWVRMQIVSTNTSSGAYLGGVALLGDARHLPKSTQVTT